MLEHVSIPMGPIGPTHDTGTHTTQEQDGTAPRQLCMLDKTPTPIYRHAAPSGPWPWMDFDEDIPAVDASATQFKGWRGYPQSSFPNWTESQVKRCEMLTAHPSLEESQVYRVDVRHDGGFNGTAEMATVNDSASVSDFWELVNRRRDENVRVRAVFVKNMTREVLQMLGTRYTIEPFFFSSSTNWIPSRYQENLIPKESDHITVVLPFIRVVDREVAGPLPQRPQPKESDSSSLSEEDDQVIDTHAPLYLDSGDKYILQDLLSVHMVRELKSSTIISYHPKSRKRTAEQLQCLINRTGDSVYWSKIFHKSKDPTCLFLCFLWYAMYEWDEVFEVLYAHINHLEEKVLDSDSIRGTRDLHILQAHLLYYQTLLEDFRKSVVFVQKTPNPAMQDPCLSPRDRRDSEDILKRETDYLISEIERLESQRSMQVLRLKNVMNLAFASVNIDDSRYMKELTIATVRDSAAMKQLSYLTMIFLPANFMSNVFSMNVVEINPQGAATVGHYVAAAVSLTIFAAWVAVALQTESRFFPSGSPLWKRVCWPVFFMWDMWLYVYHWKFVGKRKKI